MSEITVERLKNNVRTAADRVFDGNLAGFMRIMTDLYGFDYKNQLLIWRQMPEAKCVAGASAFKNHKLSLKDKASPIFLLYPKFNLAAPAEMKTGEADSSHKVSEDIPMYGIEYIPVQAYDISDTEGGIPPTTPRNRNISEVLRANGISVVTAGKKAEDAPKDPRVFVVDEGMSTPVEVRENLIRKFCTYVTEAGKDKDVEFDRIFEDDIEKIIRDIVVFCVQRHFREEPWPDNMTFLSHMEVLLKQPIEEKLRIIKRISRDVSDAIRMLDGPVITYNEMAIINAFLRSVFIGNEPKNDRIAQLLAPGLNTIAISDGDIQEDIERFLDYIPLCDDTFLKSLFLDVKERRAYIYPPKFYRLIK